MVNDFPSALALAVDCRNWKDNGEALNASSTLPPLSPPPPGACYCWVLIYSNVKETTTLARTVIILGA